jgi:hypothetical protein
MMLKLKVKGPLRCLLGVGLHGSSAHWCQLNHRLLGDAGLGVTGLVPRLLGSNILVKTD